MNTRKTLFICMAFVLASLCATAQNPKIGAEIRDDIVEAESNGNEYTIFFYKQKDGTCGYWLGLGGVDNIPGSPIVFDQVTETCIYLGATAADALATLDDIVASFKMPLTEKRDFPAMLAVGRPLAINGTAACFVQKVLFGRRLCFRLTHEKYTTDSYLTKSGAKNLRSTFKFNARKALKEGY